MKRKKSDAGPNGVEKPNGGTRKRFTDQEKARALKLLRAGQSRSSVAKAVGTSSESVRLWALALAAGSMPGVEKALEEIPSKRPAIEKEPHQAVSEAQSEAKIVLTKAEARRSPYAPKDPGQGLADHEVVAILELKKDHPSMGPAQLRAQLKRFKGWRISLKAIARVLRGHGYEPVHRGAPKGPEPIRFESPRRNHLWQADFAEVRVGLERLYVLIILDDFSRFIVGHSLSESPSSDVATATLKAAIARHGKPESVRTDRGRTR